MTDRICKVDGCDSPSRALKMCVTHFNRFNRYGSTDPHIRKQRPRGFAMPPRPVLGDDVRFWEKVNKTDTCWEWVGDINATGYGRFWVGRRDGHNTPSHRWAYEALVGPIPEELVLDHLCRVRHCVNPAHLEPVTNRENILRGESPHAINARKTHCIRGHIFDTANTYKYNGERHCRACLNDAARRYRERQRSRV